MSEPTPPKPGAITEADLLRWFAPAAPSAEEIVAGQAIRKAAVDLARMILSESQPCPDQTVAIRTLREVVVWAQAALRG